MRTAGEGDARGLAPGSAVAKNPAGFARFIGLVTVILIAGVALGCFAIERDIWGAVIGIFVVAGIAMIVGVIIGLRQVARQARNASGGG